MIRLITALCLLVVSFSCGKPDVRVVRAVDRENMSMVLLAGEDAALQEIYDADFVIVGGSPGGLVAAFAACAASRKTILIEEEGQLAACFADTNTYFDNSYTATTGTSERVKLFRQYIRDWYKQNGRDMPYVESPALEKLADFGDNNFCFETDAALAAVDSILAAYEERGRLTVLTRHKVTEVITYSQRVQSLTVVDLDAHKVHQVRGWAFIDATGTGELLPLAGIDFAMGSDRPGVAIPDSAAMYDVYYYHDEIAGKESGESVAPLLDEPPVGDDVTVGAVSLARAPRLLRGFRTVMADDIAASLQPGPRAAFFNDAVGIGYSPMLRYGGVSGDTTAVATRPFQIPLGAMIPREFANIIVGGPSIGTDPLAASAYDAPAVLMAIGESAGVVSEYAAGHNVSMHEILDDPARLLAVQEYLINWRKVPIYWYDNVSPGDSLFAEAQMAPFLDPAYDGVQTSLSYEPDR